MINVNDTLRYLQQHNMTCVCLISIGDEPITAADTTVLWPIFIVEGTSRFHVVVS